MKKNLVMSILALILPVGMAFAQERAESKEHSHEPKKPVIKSAGTPKAAESELADIILAQAMENIWIGGDAFFHRGEWNHNINLNRIIVQAEPWRDECYTNSAYLLWSSDRNDQAIAFLKQGIAANPKSYPLLDELGYHYAVNLKQPTEGIPYYELAMKTKQPQLQFYTAHNLARAYEKTSQLDKALKIWEIAVDMQVSPSIPNNPIAEQGIKRVKAKLAAKP